MKWQKNFVLRATVWLTAEILLNILGIDDLADYSEFLLEGHNLIAAKQVLVAHPLKA